MNIQIRSMKAQQMNVLSDQTESCPICHLSYDHLSHIPMMLCPEQHLACKPCTDQLLKEQRIKCPECRQPVVKQNIRVFRRFYKIIQEKKNRNIQIFTKAHEVQEKLSNINKQSLKRPLEINSEEELEKIKAYKIFKDNQLEKLQKAMLNQAIQHFKNKDITKCISLCRTIIQNNPKQNGVFEGLGFNEEQIGYYERQILKWFQMKNYSSRICSYDLLNLCSLNQKKYKESRQWYQKMAQLYPQNIKILYGLAIAEYNSKRKKKASQICKKIINLDQNFSKSYEMLAFIALNQPEKCLSLAKKCLEKQKDNIFASYLLAHYYKQNEMIIEFENLIGTIILRQPHYIRILNLKGERLFQDQKYCLSMQVFQQSILKNPYYYQPVINKIKCLVKLEQQQQALIFGEKYNAVLGINYNFLFEMGKVYYLNQQYQQSIKYYERCYKLHFNHPFVNNQLALVYKQTKQYHKAIETYKRDLQTFEAQLETYKNIVDIYQNDLEQFQLAIQWCDKWIAVDLQNNEQEQQEANLRKVRLYIKLKRYNEALQKLYKFIDQEYEADDVYPEILEVLLIQSKYEEYLREVKKWIHASPKNIQAWQSLGNISLKISEEIKSGKWDLVSGCEKMI